jgi:hypothetical protein
MSKYNIGDTFKGRANAGDKAFTIESADDEGLYGGTATDRQGGTYGGCFKSQYTLDKYYTLVNTRDFNVGLESSYNPKPFKIDLPTTPHPPRPDGGYGYDALELSTTTLVHFDTTGTPTVAKSREAKIKLLLAAKGGVMLSVAAGRHSSDAFYVNDRAKALKHLGLKPKAEVVSELTDANGVEWVNDVRR